MTVTIRPLCERGHFCRVCGRVTIHHHVGPHRERDVSVASHLWNCSECEATVALDSPEDFALRCFRRETRRMRQRRAARRYIGRRWR